MVIDKLRDYLLGNKFTNPLSYLKTATLGAVELHWVSELAAFDFEVSYVQELQIGMQMHCLGCTNMTHSPWHSSTHYVPETKALATSSTYIITSTIQVLPMQEKADLKVLQEDYQLIGAFEFYWQPEKRPSKQELTTEPKNICKLVQQWDKI